MRFEYVGCDMDQTLQMLSSTEFPKCGVPSKGIEIMKRFRALGGKVTLWTCRSHPDWVTPAVEFCRNHGLEFDAINETLKEQIDLFNIRFPGHAEKADGRKCFFDMYIDDKDPHALARGGIDWDLIERMLINENELFVPKTKVA